MTINLSEIKAEKKILPPRIVLYSTPKLGKTTFASTIPNNLILDIEDGSGAVPVARISRAQMGTFPAFLEVLKQVYEQDHDFKVVTLDSADWLEDVIFQQAAQEHGKESIADVGYGAGYVTAVNLWRQVLQGFDMLREDRKIMPLFIAHEQIKRYDNPITESYDRYSLKLHDKTVGVIKEWADVIAFANNEVFVKSEDVGFKKKVKKAKDGERLLHTIESPAFVAGNRYGLPAELPFNWEALSDAIANLVAA